MLYMVTFTINIPPMLAYIPAPWILWDIQNMCFQTVEVPKDSFNVTNVAFQGMDMCFSSW